MRSFESRRAVQYLYIFETVLKDVFNFKHMIKSKYSLFWTCMFLFHFSLHDKYLLLLTAARIQGKLTGKHKGEVCLRLLSIAQNCCTRMVTGPDWNWSNSPPVLSSELRFCLLQLNFTAFHVENHSLCKWDSVTILNGGTPGSPVIGRYCGNKSPGIIQSGSNKLLVIFNSDHSIQGGGFYATWTAESLGKKKITVFFLV